MVPHLIALCTNGNKPYKYKYPVFLLKSVAQINVAVSHVRKGWLNSICQNRMSSRVGFFLNL